MPGKPARSRSSKSEPRRDLREEFIQAALDILAEPDDVRHKLDATTLTERAGRSLGSLSFHFRKREAGEAEPDARGGMWDLRAAVAARGLRDLTEVVRREQEKRGRPPVDGLRQMARAFVRFAVGHPRLYRLIASEMWTEEVIAQRGQILRAVREQVMLCQVTKAIRLGDPELLTQLVAGLVYGMTQSALDGIISFARAEDVVEAALNEMLKGMAAPPDAR